MTKELVELASAALGLVSSFLEVGTAVLMAWLAARQFREARPGPMHAVDPVAREEATPFRRFAHWTPRAGGRRHGRRSD